jgi:hypothetical protein
MMEKIYSKTEQRKIISANINNQQSQINVSQIQKSKVSQPGSLKTKIHLHPQNVTTPNNNKNDKKSLVQQFWGWLWILNKLIGVDNMYSSLPFQYKALSILFSLLDKCHIVAGKEYKYWQLVNNLTYCLVVYSMLNKAKLQPLNKKSIPQLY